jgi:pimeloyl-ACP methyl ester carboxylesterase
VPLKDVTLHIVDWAGGEPTIVAIHGSAGMVHNFGALAERLAPRFRLLGVDLRGHGFSDKPPSGYDLRRHIRIYEKLITEDKVDAVMGPYGSPITEVVADVTERHRKLMVAPAAGTTAIWEKGRRYLVMMLSPLERTGCCGGTRRRRDRRLRGLPGQPGRERHHRREASHRRRLCRLIRRGRPGQITDHGGAGPVAARPFVVNCRS